MSIYKKYIVAMIAGAAVTALLGLVIAYTVVTTSDFNERKEEALMFSYEITTDRLEHYVNELDQCKYTLDQALKRERKLIYKYQEETYQLNKKLSDLKSKYKYKKRLPDIEELMLDSTNIQ